MSGSRAGMCESRPAVQQWSTQDGSITGMPRSLATYIICTYNGATEPDTHTHTHNDWSVCLLYCQKGPSLPFKWE